jgi:hypothetical protein
VVVDLPPSLPQLEYLSSELELKKRKSKLSDPFPFSLFFHLFIHRHRR